jgi:hypothetical protein
LWSALAWFLLATEQDVSGAPDFFKVNGLLDKSLLTYRRLRNQIEKGRRQRHQADHPKEAHAGEMLAKSRDKGKNRKTPTASLKIAGLVCYPRASAGICAAVFPANCFSHSDHHNS